MAKKRVLGAELQVGDTIQVWWGSGLDTIVAFGPYTGPLFAEGARTAKFARNQNGMTIDNRDLFTRIGRVA